MEKIFIKNRKEQKVCVLVERAVESKGLAFIMHGLGDSKDSAHIKTFAQTFLDNAYTVVRFDTTNTFGESDGDFENANVTTYYEDLEDVIVWAKEQDFYQEPFVLCGHSLGALSSAWYAGKYSKEIKALVLAGSPINFELSKETYDPEEFANWQKTGLLIEDWGNREVHLKWSYMEEKKKYDLLTVADKLTMPILMMSGESDSLINGQKIFFDKLPGKKEFHSIAGAPHTFRNEKHLTEIYQIMDKWIKNLD